MLSKPLHALFRTLAATPSPLPSSATSSSPPTTLWNQEITNAIAA